MSDKATRGVVIHAPKDLRIKSVAAIAPGPRDVRVAIEAGGICGSDLHYFNHGGFGTVRLKEPMVLGHEIAGKVVDVGQRGCRRHGGHACRRQSKPALQQLQLLP